MTKSLPLIVQRTTAIDDHQDMWEVLKDYPAARIRLEAIAVKRLEKYRKDPLKKSE